MLHKLTQRINRTEFIRNSATLIFGTVAAQFIPILLQPFLRRIYSPEEFGFFAVYSSILGVLVTAASLKYESTVMLPKKDEDAANIVASSVILSLVSALIFGIILMIFGKEILGLFDLDEDKLWLFNFLPLSIFLFSSYQAMNFYLIRKKAFKVSSLNKVIRRGSEGVTQLGLGFGFKSIGLILGNIIGDLLNFSMGMLQLKRKGFQFSWLRKVKMLALMKRYKDFPLYNSLPAVLNTLSLSLPVLIISNIYGEQVTGYFDLSRMVLALPLALVSVSVSQVLFQNIAERIREKKSIRPLIMKMSFYLGLVASLMVLLGYALSVPVFKLVFGENWELSGVMTQILIASYAMKFVVSPLSITFNALEKIAWSSAWQLIYFIAILCLFLVKNVDVETFLTYYLVIDVTAYGLYYLIMLWQVNKYEKTR